MYCVISKVFEHGEWSGSHYHEEPEAFTKTLALAFQLNPSLEVSIAFTGINVMDCHRGED